MKKILIYFLFLLVVLSSCEKKNNYYSDNTIEDSYLENLEIQILNDIKINNNDFQKIMYVIASDGIVQRKEPSLDSTIIGKLLYCEPVVLFNRSETQDTINGITDYWYETGFDMYFEGQYILNSWVFGGYLADKLPSDAPISLFEGYWIGDLENEGFSYIFSGNTYIFGAWHGEVNVKGTFSFTNETIIFTELFFIGWHSEEGWKKMDSIVTHTYSLSDETLKISKEPINSDSYNLANTYILEKSTIQ